MAGYQICVKRLHWFLNNSQALQGIDQQDKLTLIKHNIQAAVNIKAAKMLRPSNGLAKQLKCAMGNAQGWLGAVQKNNNRLEYGQIFRSPWCASESKEIQFQRDMEDLFKVGIDQY